MLARPEWHEPEWPRKPSYSPHEDTPWREWVYGGLLGFLLMIVYFWLFEEPMAVMLTLGLQ